MAERIDLDEAVGQGRTPMDANWSARKKALVAGGSVLLAILAIGAGAWVTLAQRPPSMPTSAEEALAIMRTGAFERLDEERKSQYAAEARRLLGNLSDEERRALLEGEENRDALWDLRLQMMEERARRLARGENAEDLTMPRPSEEERQRMRERWENMSEEERAEMRREMMDQARQRVTQEAESGNGQSSALIQEMRRSGQGRGGGGGGGGGRRGGGR